MNVGPSILIAMNNFSNFVEQQTHGEWHRNCVTLACDDANCFLQSRPPDWNALHNNVGHSQYGTGGGRPGNPLTYVEKMHVSGEIGAFIGERNKKGGWKAMENCKSSLFLAYWPNVFQLRTSIGTDGYQFQMQWFVLADMNWKAWRFWVFGLVCSVSPSKKLENFLGCPLFPPWFFWLTWPGQMEYLTS